MGFPNSICSLKWEWEIKIPQLNTFIFVIPAEVVKNKKDRLVILNDIAKSIVNKKRGIHGEYVFSYKDKRIGKINNSAWKNARTKEK